MSNFAKMMTEIWNEYYNNLEKLATDSTSILEKYLPNKKLKIDYNIETIYSKETERKYMIKQRLLQSYFRGIVLSSYNNTCCITGINIPEVLRASHITAWSDDKTNRMNPTNGLCLSATYDAAFDRHLISFDEDYRMLLSPKLNEYTTNKAFNEYFIKFEGKQITLPKLFLPNQTLLEKHRKRASAQ